MRKSYICCPKRLKSNNGTEIRGKIRTVHGGIHGGRTDGRFWYFLQSSIISKTKCPKFQNKMSKKIDMTKIRKAVQMTAFSSVVLKSV